MGYISKSRPQPGTVTADFGISRESPVLPFGICAELTFDLAHYDDEIVADEANAEVDLTDEEGTPIPLDKRLMPLVREALIARLHIKKKGSAQSPWERMLVQAVMQG